MRFVLVMLAVCACNDPPGLELEVIAGDGIAKVELIPAHACETCPPDLAAPGTRIRREEALTSTQPTRWIADTDQDGVATFRLVTDGSGDEEIPVLTAVGFDANDTAIAALPLLSTKVPGQRGEYWQVRLDRDAYLVSGIDDLSHPDGTVQVDVWHYPNQPEASCVMFERWDSGSRTTSAIMPPGDPDCDNANPECLTNVPNAKGQPPPLNESSCGATKTLTSGPACVLGGSTCTDGLPTSDASCVPIADDVFCVPQQVCACSTCAFNAFVSDTNVPFINCTVPFDSTGHACNGGSTSFDASIFLGGVAKCTAFHFLPGFLTGLQIKDSITIGSTGTMTVSNFQQTCSVTMTVTGTLAVGSSAVELTDLELDNGRHLAIPIRVHAESGCTGNQFACTPIKPSSMTETIYNCLR